MPPRRTLITLAASLVVATGHDTHAQPHRFAFAPPAADVRVTKDVAVGTSDTVALHMDVYQRPRVGRALRPALIFFNRAFGAERGSSIGGFYAAWAQTAASNGLVGILPDLRGGSEAADFRALLDYLARHGAEHGIDTAAIAVYAASGNAYTALPLLEDTASALVKAAVIYYGAGSVTTFRRDLPVLYVRAGLDRPGMNEEIARLAAAAIAQNAPLTLLNHPTGYHGFELANDDDATRAVIDATLAFVRRTTSASYRESLRRGTPEAAAAGNMQTGHYREAASIYADLLRTRPDDARLRLSYGEALLGATDYATACAEFEKLKDKGLGYRDLGLPAARACMQKGDADAAIAWLKSIPTRFLPVEVQHESVFAAIRDRAEFRALFTAR